MTLSRLLTLCFIATGMSCYAQSVYQRIITDFTPMADGKTEWIDLDNDNDLDLLMMGSDGSVALTIVYENVAGVLSPRTTNLPALSGFASADYDADGDTDLLVFNWKTPFTKLYRNDGGFSFSEVTSFGTFAPGSAIWFDFDNDEDPDFLLTDNTLQKPRLFENTGTGFTEITNANLPTCRNCNADVADINGDGKVDIVFNGEVTVLYLNTGNKTFVLDATAEFKPRGGGVACGDFDGDGDFDILMTGQFNSTEEFTAIYENRNNRFVERTDLGLIGVTTPSPSGGLLWFNIDNDGKIDIFLSGSSEWTNAFAGKARVYKNGGGTFTDIQDAYLGTDRFMGSYDAGDFDNDGDMDLGFQGTYAALEGFPIPFPRTKRLAGYYRHSQASQTVVLNTKPLPPAVETFSESAYRKEIRLKWGTGSDAQTPAGGLFYNFYLRDANKKIIVPNVRFSNGNVYTTNAPNGTGRAGYAFDMPEGTLYYAVQSIDGAKTGSVFSTEKSFYHFNGPESVAARFVDQQHVNLSWLDHSSLETNFEVSRSTSPTTGFSPLAVLPLNTKSYADNFAFATETLYYYRIRGYNAQASVYDSLVLVIPNRPADIAAQSVNAATIKLTWLDQSQYETAYIIERKQGAGSFTTIATLDPNVVQYVDTQLSDGVVYEYRVTSKGNNGALAPIVSVTAKTNAKPIGVDFESMQDEDKTFVFAASDLHGHFTDADATDKLVRLKIVSLPENGTLYVYTSRAVVGQEVTPDLFNFIEFVPATNYVGTTSFNVLPYDGRDYGAKDWNISLKINPVNDPPVFDLPSSRVVDEDFVLIQSIIPQLSYFPAEENQVVTYALSPQTSDVVKIDFNTTTGEILLTRIKDKFGAFELTVTANDGQSQNNTYSRKIKVTVRPVDDPPVFGAIANVETSSSSVTIDLDVTDIDNDVAASMFAAYSNNNTIVKGEKIKFSRVDEKIKMTIVSEAKEGETMITVNLSGGGFYINRQFRFSRLLITALETDPAGDILVFPNPVIRELQIQRGTAGGEELTFCLSDVYGRRVHSGTIGQSTVSVDLGEFASGIYYLEIVRNHRTVASKKIIKL